MALPIEFYVYVGYGLFAMVAVAVIINFLLGGLFRPFMQVKRSRGAMVLIRIRHPVHDYFRAGRIEEGWLIFVDREKHTRRIVMRSGVVSRGATVNWVEVDDEKNALILRETSSAIQTHDAIKTDSLYVRALYKPNILGDNVTKIILVLLIVVLIILIVLTFMTVKNGKAIVALMNVTQNIGGVIV